MPILTNNKYYIIKSNGKYYDIYNPFAMFTFTIVPTPSNATVTLTAQGYTQVGNSITVRRGTTVSWQVRKTNYYTQTGSITVNSDTTQSVGLVYALATLTINPTPSDATVTLSASGYSQVGKSITVEKGTSVSWTVSKDGYIARTGSQQVNSDESLDIVLQSEFTPQTIRFDYTGAVQTWTVPAGVSKLIVDCVGAGSGSLVTSSSGTVSGGNGGRVQCKLNITSGQTLYIYVGGKGLEVSGGWNGGGKGGQVGGDYKGSGGGGATDIRINGTNLDDRIIVSGGAGGSGGLGYIGSSGGGLSGANGSGTESSGYRIAYGGTQSSGGRGGGYTGQYAKDGTFGNGGNGYLGAGGGGGYYGGGGGFSGVYSGAGGSSYTHPTLCTNVVHTQGYSQATGNGWIIITTSNE